MKGYLPLIMQSSMTTVMFKSKWKIVITDYVDYPVLQITITYTGIFSRNFSVVLHASLAIIFSLKTLKSDFVNSNNLYNSNNLCSYIKGVLQILLKFGLFSCCRLFCITLNSSLKVFSCKFPKIMEARLREKL